MLLDCLVAEKGRVPSGHRAKVPAKSLVPSAEKQLPSRTRTAGAADGIERHALWNDVGPSRHHFSGRSTLLSLRRYRQPPLNGSLPLLLDFEPSEATGILKLDPTVLQRCVGKVKQWYRLVEIAP